MLEQDSKLLYQEWLTKDQASKKKCQVCACTCIVCFMHGFYKLSLDPFMTGSEKTDHSTQLVRA